MTQQNSPRNDGRLLSLQVLRAIAALMVAVGHLYPIDQRFFGGPVLPAATQFGFAGVDLFFVISGFVMVYLTRSAAGHSSAIPAFLLARVARIYPLWWLSLGIIAAVWMVRPGWVFASIPGAPNLLADFALWPSTRKPLLAVGWTLIHEMYFYLAFALLLVLPARRLYAGMVGWMVLVAIGNVCAGPFNQETAPVWALLTHPLTLDFGLGAMVGAAAVNRVRPAPGILVIAGILWAVTAALLKLNTPLSVFEDDWTRVLSFGPAWAMLVWGMVGLEADHAKVPLKALSGLGDASYALYLIHVPIFAACARIAALFCGPAAWDNVVAWILLLTAACTCALVLHRVVEKPLLKKLARIRFKLMPTGSALLQAPPSLPPLNLNALAVA